MGYGEAGWVTAVGLCYGDVQVYGSLLSVIAWIVICTMCICDCVCICQSVHM